VKVKLSVGDYKDKVLCDVVPMEACHILLGRPWQFDKKTMHNGFTNEITFTHKEKKFILYPLPPLMEEAQAPTQMQAHQSVELGQPLESCLRSFKKTEILLLMVEKPSYTCSRCHRL